MLQADVSRATMECDMSDEMIPLFRIVPGETTDSMASICCSRVGFDADYCERVKVISRCIQQGSPIPKLKQNDGAISLETCKFICNLLLDMDNVDADVDNILRMITF